MFDRVDRNRDGLISRGERSQAFGGGNIGAGQMPVAQPTGMNSVLKSRLDAMGDSVGRLNQQHPPSSMLPLRPTSSSRGLPPAVSNPPPPPAPPPPLGRGGPQHGASAYEAAMPHGQTYSNCAPSPAARGQPQRDAMDYHPLALREAASPAPYDGDAREGTALPRLLRGLERGDLSVNNVLARLDSELRSRPHYSRDEAERFAELLRPYRDRPLPADLTDVPNWLDFKQDLLNHQDPTSGCRRCTARDKEEAILRERDRVMEQLVTALGQSLAGLGASMFNWSLYQDLDDWERDGLSSLVLSYLTPCAHVDQRIADVCGRIQAGIRKALISPEDAAELLRARQRAVDRAQRERAREVDAAREDRKRLQELEARERERDREAEERRKEQERMPSQRVTQQEAPKPPQGAFKGALRHILVKIVSAKNLRKADSMSDSDAYVMCWPGSRKSDSIRTKVVESQNPVWNHTQMMKYNPGEPLHFHIWDQDHGRSDQRLGDCTLAYEVFAHHGFKGNIEMRNTGNAGHVTLQVQVTLPVPLKVQVVKGSLEAHLQLNPYVIVEVQHRSKFTTTPKTKTKDPVWNEEHEFPDYFPGDRLHVSLYNHHSLNHHLGEALLMPDTFMPKGFNGEVKLVQKDQSTGNKVHLVIKIGYLDAGPVAQSAGQPLSQEQHHAGGGDGHHHYPVHRSDHADIGIESHHLHHHIHPQHSQSFPPVTSQPHHQQPDRSHELHGQATQGSLPMGTIAPDRHHAQQAKPHGADPASSQQLAAQAAVPPKVRVEFTVESGEACNGIYLLRRQKINDRPVWHCPQNGMYILFEEPSTWLIKDEKDQDECFAYCEDDAALPTEVTEEWGVMDDDDGFVSDPSGGVYEAQ